MHENEVLNPIPLVQTPFIYSLWKKDYLKFKANAKQVSTYTKTCDALINYIENISPSYNIIK